MIVSQTIVFDSSDNTGCTLHRLSNGIVIWSIASWTKYSTLKSLVGVTLPEKFRPSIGIIKFFPFFQSDWLDYGFAYISIDSSGKITALTEISKNDTAVLEDSSLISYTFEYVGK